jgi:hypothetical protein
MAPAARIWEAVMAVADRKDHGSGRASGRKDKIVHARFSAAEFVAIEQAAVAADMTVSGFMRSLALEGAGVYPFFTDDDRAVLAILHRDLRAIGTNLNQMARTANRGQIPSPDRFRETSGELRTLIAAVMLELRSHCERGRRRRVGG